MIILTFFIGIIANFIGYVPPGNINLTVVQLAINRGMREAMKFIIAFSCVEFFFTWFIMNGVHWLAQQVHLDTVVDWVMIVLFVTMGIIAWRHRKVRPQTKKRSKQHSIRFGIIMGIVNPVQIPFWIITGSYLITNGWIATGLLALIIFSIGSAGGAFLCLFIYARSARYVQRKLDLSNKAINTGVALLLFGFAAYTIAKQVYLVFFKH
ncbi:LysE family translocator [Mucilaginibacter sp.]|uniref:LysE family translocator n=1 Tax=Mucilaginibacter sp. TaxID=1882438 RepID=UPI002C26367B|nr:LysE family transporter [Mucilaginibacter sp.]HTI61225.1 LysE family transporter [Mucilaginibacter sp.]